MRKLTAALAAMALVVIFGGTAQAAHVFTGPNETATKGATVTFNVDWPHGSITLTCEQGVTQVLNKTQKVTTGFLLDSASWVANTPANCDALWYYIPGAGQPRVTEGELTFASPTATLLLTTRRSSSSCSRTGPSPRSRDTRPT